MALERPVALALVTGAGGALGAAVCAQLLRDGFRVLALDRDAVANERTVLSLGAPQAAIAGRTLDVGAPAAVGELFDELRHAADEPGVLVHCAGTPGRFAFLTELSDGDWRELLATHLDGAFFLLRAAAAGMRRRGSGRVVFISSLAGRRGAVASAAYSAAKAGLHGLAWSAAKELGPWGITVNAIAPGMIATPPNLALERKGSGFIGRALAETPSRLMSRPEDIAALVGFLVSAAAANINGQIIGHDGGAGLDSGIDEFLRERLEPIAAEPPRSKT
ncbi:MAG: SDR family oxidoreductase [Betaproteobacteria bacterium]|nr:SDR family oxidoreductase [Betaproteobacteria bacterium]